VRREGQRQAKRRGLCGPLRRRPWHRRSDRLQRCPRRHQGRHPLKGGQAGNQRGPELREAPALPYALIHRSAWNKNSAKFGKRVPSLSTSTRRMPPSFGPHGSHADERPHKRNEERSKRLRFASAKRPAFPQEAHLHKSASVFMCTRTRHIPRTGN
jgi:hypothetical protein